MRSIISSVLCGVLSVSLVITISGCAIGGGSESGDNTHTFRQVQQTTAQAGSSPESLPKALIPNLANALGRDNASYHVTKTTDNNYKAETPAHKFSTVFNKDGISVKPAGVEPGSWQWEIALTGVGYGDNITSVNRVKPEGSSNRVEYRMGNITEWYVNSPLGLKQGFTLSEPPSNKREEEALVLVLRTGGDLEPELKVNGKSIEWSTEAGEKVFAYGGLYAFDSKGKELPSHMGVKDEKISIHIDDADAVYPITIDPMLSEVKKLLASDAAGGDDFGISIAISGDTAIVGASFNDDAGSDSGSAYIFDSVLGKDIWRFN